MFFDAPPAGLLENFSALYNSLPSPLRSPAALARALDVTDRSVRDWLSGRRPAPFAARFFLWSYSPDCYNWLALRAHNDARQSAQSAAAWQRRADDLQSTVDALLAELATLKLAGARGAANDCTWSDSPKPLHTPHAPPRPWRH